jgi:hypothetical protein
MLLKIEINSKKPVGRKNQLKKVLTLGPMAHATLVLVQFEVQLQESKENYPRHPPKGNAHGHTKLNCR